MFRNRFHPAMMIFMALVIALVSIGIASKSQIAYASEVCETYDFYWSRKPQLYADGTPHQRTALESNGKTLPPGTYDLSVQVEDNHGNQGQKNEQASVFGKVTPDLPEYPDPNVWREATYHLGKVILTEPVSAVTVRHAFAGQKIGPQSISVSHVQLTRCFEEVVEVVTANCSDGYVELDNPTPYDEWIKGKFKVTDEFGSNEYPFEIKVASGKTGHVNIPWTVEPKGKTAVQASWTRSWTGKPGAYNSGELSCGIISDPTDSVTGTCTDGKVGLTNPTPYPQEIEGVFKVTDEFGSNEYPFELKVVSGKASSFTIPWSIEPKGVTSVTATWTRSWSEESGHYDSGKLDCGVISNPSDIVTGNCNQGYAELVNPTPYSQNIEGKFTVTDEFGTKNYDFSLTVAMGKKGHVNVPWSTEPQGATIVLAGWTRSWSEEPGTFDSGKLDCGSPPVEEKIPACNNLWAWRYTGLPFTNGDYISPWGEPLSVQVKVRHTQATRIKDESTNGWVTDKVQPDKESGLANLHIDKFRPNRKYGVYVSGFGHSMSPDPDCILYAGAWSGGMTSSLERASHDSLILKGRTVRFGNGSSMDQAYWLSENIVGLHLNALINDEVVSMPGSMLLDMQVGTLVPLTVNGTIRVFRVSGTFNNIPQGDESGRLLDLASDFVLVTCQPFSWDKNLGQYTLFTGVTLTEVQNPHIAQ